MADRPPFASERGTLQRQILCKNAVQENAVQEMLYIKCCTRNAVQNTLHTILYTNAVQEMLYKHAVQNMLYKKCCKQNYVLEML